MAKLEITKTELEPQENEWYRIKITFNTNRIISFFIKETIEIAHYNPNEKGSFLDDPTNSTTDLYNYDSTKYKP